MAFKRDRYYIASVEILAQYAGGYGVAVKTYQQIEKRGSVRDNNVFRTFSRDMQLLGKVKRVSDALVVCKSGERFQVIECNGLSAHKRIVPADKDVRLGGEQRLKSQFLVLQYMTDHLAVEPAQV